MVDLNMNSGAAYVFMSDKQKGLLGVVKDLLPKAEHRHCVRHMYNNFKKTHLCPTLKNRAWAAARDTTESWSYVFAYASSTFSDAILPTLSTSPSCE